MNFVVPSDEDNLNFAMLLSILCGLLPMLVMSAFVMWLDQYEKEPFFLLCLAFLWGATAAAGGAYFVNTEISLGLFPLLGAGVNLIHVQQSLIAPVVEETFKGAGVALIYFLARREFDSILDGMIYSGIVGLGFASAENSLYLYRNGYLSHGWAGFTSQAVLRVALIGWMHAYFTAFTGIGLAIARLNRSRRVKIFASLLGWAASIFAHATHNSIGWVIGGLGGFAIGLLADWLGFGAMFCMILAAIYGEYKVMKRQLSGEVAAGLISESQYRTALLPLTLSFAGFSGWNTLRFYTLLGKLAAKKEQLARLGDEHGNARMIESIRREIAALAPRTK